MLSIKKSTHHQVVEKNNTSRLELVLNGLQTQLVNHLCLWNGHHHLLGCRFILFVTRCANAFVTLISVGPVWEVWKTLNTMAPNRASSCVEAGNGHHALCAWTNPTLAVMSMDIVVARICWVVPGITQEGWCMTHCGSEWFRSFRFMVF